MGLIVVFAVGLASVRANDEFLMATVLVSTIGLFSTASVIALYRRGAWAGFAIFGWASYLICQPHSAPSIGAATVPNMAAYRLASAISDPIKLPSISFRIGAYPAFFTDGDGNPMLLAVQGGSGARTVMVPVNSLRAGLCLLTLAVGLVGAIVGGWVGRRERARATELQSVDDGRT